MKMRFASEMLDFSGRQDELTVFNCSQVKQRVVKFNVEWCDLLSEEFLEYAPRHWLQFHPPSCTEQRILAVLYLLIVIPGILGNGLILWLFISRHRLQTPTILLNVNTALSDLVMNLKIPLFIYNSLNCRPSIGVKGCEWYGFVGGLSGTATIASITVVTLERYITIRNSVKCIHRPLTFKYAMCLIIGVWLYALVFALPPLLGLVNRYVPEGFLTTCTFDYLTDELQSKLFILLFFAGAYLVPLSLILFSYISIYLTAVKSTRDCKSSITSSSLSSNLKSSFRRKKLALGKTTACLIALWTVAWSPYALVALYGLFTDREYLTPTLSMFPALFAKCASVIDPYVYGSSNAAFRKEIKQFLSRKKGRDSNPASKGTQSNWLRSKSNSTYYSRSNSLRVRKTAQETFV